MNLPVVTTSFTRLEPVVEVGPPRPASSWLSLALLAALFLPMTTGVLLRI